MAGFDSLVLQEQRHLKWRALDPLENMLMILCGVCITAFSVLVLAMSSPAPSAGRGCGCRKRR